MAYVNSRAASVGIVDRFGAVLRLVKDAVERRRLYSRTQYELNLLTDRELADLGLTRSIINQVAREAAYSN